MKYYSIVVKDGDLTGPYATEEEREQAVKTLGQVVRIDIDEHGIVIFVQSEIRVFDPGPIFVPFRN